MSRSRWVIFSCCHLVVMSCDRSESRQIPLTGRRRSAVRDKCNLLSFTPSAALIRLSILVKGTGPDDNIDRSEPTLAGNNRGSRR